jgi:hypothetical protein
MNERIKQLAVDAGFFYNITNEITFTDHAGTDGDLNLFAKLLIMECANIALREDHDPYECIKKHFGVEE